MSLPIILGSSSAYRKLCLSQIGINDAKIDPPNLDETLHYKNPKDKIASILAEKKAEEVSTRHKEGIIIGGDTVVIAGGVFLDKAYDDSDVEKFLRIISGKRVYVYSAVHIILKENDQILKSVGKNTIAKVKFKKLTEREIQAYVECKEGIGKAGGVMIEGYAQALVISISGSYSGILGLPLYETKNILNSIGYKNSRI